MYCQVMHVIIIIYQNFNMKQVSMYNFQSNFIYPTSHKLNAMTYGLIFYLKIILNILSCIHIKNYFIFLIGFWVDYVFVYFTLPTPKLTLQPKLAQWPKLCYCITFHGHFCRKIYNAIQASFAFCHCQFLATSSMSGSNCNA